LHAAFLLEIATFKLFRSLSAKRLISWDGPIGCVRHEFPCLPSFSPLEHFISPQTSTLTKVFTQIFSCFLCDEESPYSVLRDYPRLSWSQSAPGGHRTSSPPHQFMRFMSIPFLGIMLPPPETLSYFLRKPSIMGLQSFHHLHGPTLLQILPSWHERHRLRANMLPFEHPQQRLYLDGALSQGPCAELMAFI